VRLNWIKFFGARREYKEENQFQKIPKIIKESPEDSKRSQKS
jgi:hypothetical protein